MKKTGRTIIIHTGITRLLCLLSGIAIVVPAVIFGAFEDDSAGARARGLAGAYSAVADDSASVFSQPAGLIELSSPELGLTYGKPFAGLSDDSNIGDGAVSFGCPVSPRIGAGFGYKKLMLDGMYGETVMTGACGVQATSRLAVGASIKYLSLQYGADDYTRRDPVFASGSAVSAFDADMGIVFALLPGLNIAYVRQNILGADVGLRAVSPVPSRDRFAAAYREASFLMSAEYVLAAQWSRYLAGVEKLFANDMVGVRLGMGWGDREFRKIAAGMRVNFRQYSVDYAFDIPVGGFDGTSGTHYVTFAARWQRLASAEPDAGSARATVLQLPGMVGDQLRQAAPAEPCFVPELLPPPISCLRRPVSSSLNFDAAMSSTAARIATTLATSSNTVITPAPARKAATRVQVQSGDTGTMTVPAPASMPVATRTGPLRTYKVVAGDTLPVLAERYYGKRTDWTRIYEANRDRIEKGSLEPGAVLIIP